MNKWDVAFQFFLFQLFPFMFLMPPIYIITIYNIISYIVLRKMFGHPKLIGRTGIGRNLPVVTYLLSPSSIRPLSAIRSSFSTPAANILYLLSPRYSFLMRGAGGSPLRVVLYYGTSHWWCLLRGEAGHLFCPASCQMKLFFHLSYLPTPRGLVCHTSVWRQYPGKQIYDTIDYVAS